MINVLHFDHNRCFSENFRKKLGEQFAKNPNVNYQDFMKDNYGSFINNQQKLEILLPQKDFFLVHPGVPYAQKRVFEYTSLYPHLRIAFVFPGDFGFEKYENPNEIQLFSYDHINPIVNWVLEQESRRSVSR